MTTLYLLDTNTVAYVVDGRSQAARETMALAMEHGIVAISAVTEGELRCGLAKKPEAVRLAAAVEAFLDSVTVLPWDSGAAQAYGPLRARLAASGKTLASMDLMIAAQAVAADAILVTRDAAFAQVEALRLVNWATDL